MYEALSRALLSPSSSPNPHEAAPFSQTQMPQKRQAWPLIQADEAESDICGIRDFVYAEQQRVQPPPDRGFSIVLFIRESRGRRFRLKVTRKVTPRSHGFGI